MHPQIVALVLSLLSACGSGSAPNEGTPPPVETLPIVPQAEIDAAEGRVLAPSPLELDAAVRKAGLADTLGSLVPERTYDMAAGDQGATAVRTGVMLADTVFSGDMASDEALVERATSVRDGLRGVGARADLIARVDDMIARLKAGASTRAEILAEVDGITAAMVPDEGWGPEDRSGPLVQAGVWLEGANLVAAACVAKGDAEAATGLLRDRELVTYFLRYLQVQGTSHAPSPVVDKLIEVLHELQALTAKDRLAIDDVARIQGLTGSVLALL